CRAASRAYDRLITMAMPALGVESDSDLGGEQVPDAWSIEDAEKRLMGSLGEEQAPTVIRPVPERVPTPWNLSHWWRYAAAALVLAASSLSAYRLGLHKGRTPDVVRAPVSSPVPGGSSSIGGAPAAALPTRGNLALPEDPRV